MTSTTKYERRSCFEYSRDGPFRQSTGSHHNTSSYTSPALPPPPPYRESLFSIPLASANNRHETFNIIDSPPLPNKGIAIQVEKLHFADLHYELADLHYELAYLHAEQAATRAFFDTVFQILEDLPKQEDIFYIARDLGVSCKTRLALKVDQTEGRAATIIRSLREYERRNFGELTIEAIPSPETPPFPFESYLLEGSMHAAWYFPDQWFPHSPDPSNPPSPDKIQIPLLFPKSLLPANAFRVVCHTKQSHARERKFVRVLVNQDDRSANAFTPSESTSQFRVQFPEHMKFKPFSAAGKEDLEAWKAGAGRSKSWKTPNSRELSRLSRTHTVNKPKERYFPAYFMRGRKGFSRQPVFVDDERSEPIQRRQKSRPKDSSKSMKPQYRHRNLAHIIDESGFSIDELAEQSQTSVQPYLVKPQNRPFLAVRMLMNTSFTRDNLDCRIVNNKLGPMRLPCQKIMTPSYYFALCESYYSTEAQTRQISDSFLYPKINQRILPEMENVDTKAIQLPEYYNALSGPGKRRARKARQKQIAKATVPQKLAPPKNRTLRSCIAPELKKWRKRKLQQKKDPFSQCHLCWQTFSCGHPYRTLCSECDLSWDKGQSIECPLHKLRAIGYWQPDKFLVFRSKTCSICRNKPVEMNGQQRLKLLESLPRHVWEDFETKGKQFNTEDAALFQVLMDLCLEDKITVETVLNMMAPMTLRDYEHGHLLDMDEDEQYEQEVWASGYSTGLIGRDPLAWDEQIFDYRDFRRRPR